MTGRVKYPKRSPLAPSDEDRLTATPSFCRYDTECSWKAYPGNDLLSELKKHVFLRAKYSWNFSVFYKCFFKYFKLLYIALALREKKPNRRQLLALTGYNFISDARGYRVIRYPGFRRVPRYPRHA